MPTATEWTLEGAEALTSRAKHPPVYLADLDLSAGVVIWSATGRAPEVLRQVGAPVEWLPAGWLLITRGDAQGFTEAWAVPALADHAPAFDVLLAVDVLVDESR